MIVTSLLVAVALASGAASPESFNYGNVSSVGERVSSIATDVSKALAAARAKSDMGDSVGAEIILRDAISGTVFDVPLEKELSKLLLRRGSYAEALRVLRSHHQRTNDEWSLVRIRLVEAIQGANQEENRNEGERIVRFYSSDDENLLSFLPVEPVSFWRVVVGVQAEMTGNTLEASEEYRLALSRDPENRLLSFWMGRIFMSDRSLLAAISYFKVAAKGDDEIAALARQKVAVCQAIAARKK